MEKPFISTFCRKTQLDHHGRTNKDKHGPQHYPDGAHDFEVVPATSSSEKLRYPCGWRWHWLTNHPESEMQMLLFSPSEFDW